MGLIKCTLEIREKIVSLYVNDFCSAKKISEKFGLTHGYVVLILKENNVFNRCRGRFTDLEKQEIINLYNSNVSCRKIGKKFSVHFSTIAAYLKKWGIKLQGQKKNTVLNKYNITDKEVIEKYEEFINTKSLKEKHSELTAKFFKISRAAVDKILRRNKIETYGLRKKRIFEEQKYVIYDLYFNKLYSFQEIADIYNISMSWVSKKFIKFGWKAREATYSDTKPERDMEIILKNLSLKYEKQFKLVGKFYDFYLCDYNTLIEVHGDYWHGNPRRYKNEHLDETQREARINDVCKKHIAEQNGFKLISFWEYDIIRNANEVTEEIKNNL